jgi:hypothetical protein
LLLHPTKLGCVLVQAESECELPSYVPLYPPAVSVKARGVIEYAPLVFVIT